jgi:uncharacterized phage protein (TIGR02218 family)
MRILPGAMQAHLDSGTTTLCHCWRLTLRNGEQLGFTDHDAELSFAGTVFECQAGFTGSEIESSLGLSIDNLEATGALKSGKLDEARLRAGDFDHAAIAIWRVNWQDVTQRLLMRNGHLGEVATGAGGFTAEVRGLAHLFNQTNGRIYQFGCDAGLGDNRCTVAITSPAYQGSAIVTSVDGATLHVAGLNSFADDWFTLGAVLWTTGSNAGRQLPVRRHRLLSSSVRVELWQTPPFAVSPGEPVILRAGCDKQFQTCGSKFGNAINYRGFPHMPGNDFVLSIAGIDDPDNNGGRRSN